MFIGHEERVFSSDVQAQGASVEWAKVPSLEGTTTALLHDALEARADAGADAGADASPPRAP